MSKVYIVTAGDYSSYRICAVFSTKAKAEEYIAEAARASKDKGRDFNPIEEYELDLYEDKHPGLYPWRVHMEKDGSTKGFQSWQMSFPFDADYSFEFLRHETECLRNDCWAKDKDHAIKITNELRVRLIADNQWPEAGK